MKKQTIYYLHGDMTDRGVYCKLCDAFVEVDHFYLECESDDNDYLIWLNDSKNHPRTGLSNYFAW
jgi:hypothetical protein